MTQYAQSGTVFQSYPITAGNIVNVFKSKNITHNTDTIIPHLNRSAVVNDLLVYAIKFGGVDDGNMKAQLQQQVTGNNNVNGLKPPSTATPITTGIMIFAQAVLDTKIPINTIITEISNTATY